MCYLGRSCLGLRLLRISSGFQGVTLKGVAGCNPEKVDFLRVVCYN